MHGLADLALLAEHDFETCGPMKLLPKNALAARTSIHMRAFQVKNIECLYIRFMKRLAAQLSSWMAVQSREPCARAFYRLWTPAWPLSGFVRCIGRGSIESKYRTTTIANWKCLRASLLLDLQHLARGPLLCLLCKHQPRTRRVRGGSSIGCINGCGFGLHFTSLLDLAFAKLCRCGLVFIC